jgi:chemotaxis protein MotB
VQVEGHTDNRELASFDAEGEKGVTGPGSSNWQLSLNRSYHLVRFLVEGSNFPQNKISVSGFGDTQPIADNTTPEGRKKNRRVEISVISQNQSLSDLPW